MYLSGRRIGESGHKPEPTVVDRQKDRAYQRDGRPENGDES